MVVMLPPLLVSGPLDGEGAVASARAFLVRMGVPKVGGLLSLAEQEGKGWKRTGKVWAVGFETSKGGFSVLMDADGTVFYASAASRNGPNLDDATARRFADRLIARVPQVIPVRFDSISKGTAAGASARYVATVDGRRYFNLNPDYGYFMSFDPNGVLTRFGREDRPPRPASRVPKVTRVAAVAKLTPIMRRTPPTDWPYPRFVEPELGYYVRKGEPNARLVWRGTTTFLNHRLKGTLGTIKTLVDATTGETFEGDDQ